MADDGKFYFTWGIKSYDIDLETNFPGYLKRRRFFLIYKLVYVLNITNGRM